ncbi:hypothetical protein EYF80_065811 [Liparis tanakae]|uniref:Uncharacterized protein n=1 Tax=Liparis tanakae TaxID=230148 RepID=A0A4Z2E5R3_9TELE|nr:hypothetical protein EYF80_065811 [Liparis tanakae]
MPLPALDFIRIASDNEGNRGEAGIAFVGQAMPGGGWGRGGWRPQVPYDDDEGEEDHWDSEDDSGYMSEGEDEEEEDDQPFHPLPSPSLVRRPPSSTGQKRTQRPASNPPRRGPGKRTALDPPPRGPGKRTGTVLPPEDTGGRMRTATRIEADHLFAAGF